MLKEQTIQEHKMAGQDDASNMGLEARLENDGTDLVPGGPTTGVIADGSARLTICGEYVYAVMSALCESANRGQPFHEWLLRKAGNTELAGVETVPSVIYDLSNRLLSNDKVVSELQREGMVLTASQ